VAASDAAGDLCLYNPILRASEAQGLVCCIMLLMMTSNRISHATLALQQARGLLKLLNQLQTADASVGADPIVSERIRKELLTQSDTLAATLAARRHYAVPVAPGMYEVDPRFLLFEFCHGILLRQSQVQLVNKLLSEVNAGHSVCHQVRRAVCVHRM
jgi:hypothetical protein